MRAAFKSQLTGAALLPSLDLRFAEDKAFTNDPAVAAGCLITARRGPNAKFSRASGATQTNASGLIEYAPENICLQSSDFSNAAWVKNGVTVTADQATSPDGTNSADLLVVPNVANSHLSQDYGPGNGTVITASIWLRTVSGSATIRLTLIDVTGWSGSTQVSAAVTATWQRFTITRSNGTGSLYFAVGNSDSTAYGGGSVYAWGAQLERHPSARDYLATTSARVYGPRFDHDPVTLECKGLLIEEARTNLCLQSASLNTSPWSVLAGQAWGAGSVADAALAPDGLSTADKYTESASGSGVAILRQFVTTAASTTYTLSIYAKYVSRRYISVFYSDGVDREQIFDIQNGVKGATSVNITSSTITNVGNGWYRCSITFTTRASPSLFAFDVRYSGSDISSSTNYTRTGAYNYIWGAQLEVGAFATSYIPTTTASVTRAADLCSITGSDFTSFYNQSEGTFYGHASINSPSDNNSLLMNVSDGTGNERIQFGFTSWTGEALRCYVIDGGVVNGGPLHNGTIGVGAFGKIALAYKLNDFAGVFNSGTVVTDSSGTLPTVNQVAIGQVAVGTACRSVHINRLQYFRKRLSNTKLQQLTL